MKALRSPYSREGVGAFSLCEVVIALGIFAFALIALLGLLPTALQSARDSLDISTAVQLADQLSAKLNQADFSSLAPDGSEKLFYFDDTGNELPSREGAVYQASEVLEESESENLVRAEITMRRITSASMSKTFCYLIFNNG